MDNPSAGRTQTPGQGDASTLRDANDVLSGGSKRGFFARMLPFLGPAFIASVAYMDPGNFATNIQAGSQYGYMLLWVVLASNLMAMLVQSLSAKLGIASGQNLAELLRSRSPIPVAWGMWILMEVVAMATDLAEFLGAAVGFQLLFHLPLMWGGILTGIATFIILGLQRHGFRWLEAVITALVGVIAVAYLLETIMDRPNWAAIGRHSIVPEFKGVDSIVLAAGILGATVMPHVIFLHSALTQGRIVTRDPDRLKRLYRFELMDVLIAMGLAGLINMAMLIMASSTFHYHGLQSIGKIEDAYQTLKPLLGSAASKIFAISLLASGLSSSAVGTMSGQVIMQGFVHWQIPVWLRRAITMAPSLIVIKMGFDPTTVLVASQVILSFGIPFALIPLVAFTRRKDLMGVLVNHWITTLLACLVGVVIIALNIFIIWKTISGLGG